MCDWTLDIINTVRPVFVQVVSSPLGWSPLSSFLVIWSPSGDARGPSVVFEAVDMPCSGPFHFSPSVDYIYFCPVPDTDVGLSILVCDIEHTSFHFLGDVYIVHDTFHNRNLVINFLCNVDPEYNQFFFLYN